MLSLYCQYFSLFPGVVRRGLEDVPFPPTPFTRAHGVQPHEITRNNLVIS